MGTTEGDATPVELHPRIVFDDPGVCIRPLSLYRPRKKLLPICTRVFADFVVEQFCAAGYAQSVRGD